MVLQLLENDVVFLNQDTQAAVLRCQQAGVDVGTWPLEGLQHVLQENLLLSPDAEARVLQAIAQPLATFKTRYGYPFQDIVGLHPDTPGLEATLSAFRPLHYHEDDEVRVVLQGEGIFGFTPEGQAPFEVKLEAGDWIRIPAGMPHYFYLSDAKAILALRLFSESPRWEAIYV